MRTQSKGTKGLPQSQMKTNPRLKEQQCQDQEAFQKADPEVGGGAPQGGTDLGQGAGLEGEVDQDPVEEEVTGPGAGLQEGAGQRRATGYTLEVITNHKVSQHHSE